MNEVSPTAMQAMLAQQTKEVFLSFMRVEHSSLSQPLRFVCNYTPVTRADGVYEPYAFNAPAPAQTEDGVIPKTTITIDNTDLTLGATLRKLVGAPTVTLFTALASSPDYIEEGPFQFLLNGVDGDINQITGHLGYDGSVFDQTVPAMTYTPSNSAGLFM